jgi:LysR family transcriptional regulator (chromosome initiation inhibitor)
MVPDLQAEGRPRLVELDAQGTVDVRLYWQQWRLPSPALQDVADGVRGHAAAHLR